GVLSGAASARLGVRGSSRLALSADEQRASVQLGAAAGRTRSVTDADVNLAAVTDEMARAFQDSFASGDFDAVFKELDRAGVAQRRYTAALKAEADARRVSVDSLSAVTRAEIFRRESLEGLVSGAPEAGSSVAFAK